MDKGIWFGSGLDFYKDMKWIVEKGFTAVYIGINGGPEEQLKRANYARQHGIKILIVDIRNKNWKDTVDNVDAEYYYVDEPYLHDIPTKELQEKLDYILDKRPNNKFVIGDIREIQRKKYLPLIDLYYTYTSYTNNWYIPIIDRAIPIGLGNQSPSIKRVYKRVDGRMPFIWVYGKNKIFCHPDEYHKLEKTCKKLNINLMMLYLQSGSDKFRKVSKNQVLNYVDHFLNGTKPYTFKQWWQRLYCGIKSSVLDFIENLF